MINFEKEIAKYKPIELEKQETYKGTIVDIKTILNDLSDDIEKIRKLQYKSAINMEDIVEQIEELKEVDGKEKSLYEEVIKDIEIKGQQIDFLVNGIIEIVDLFDQIYNYSLKNSVDTWTSQLSIQRENAINILNKIGVIKIDKIGVDFNLSIHSVKKVVNTEGKKENEIVEVIKSGYIYENRVIRKAEVVITSCEIRE